MDPMLEQFLRDHLATLGRSAGLWALLGGVGGVVAGGALWAALAALGVWSCRAAWGRALGALSLVWTLTLGALVGALAAGGARTVMGVDAVVASPEVSAWLAGEAEGVADVVFVAARSADGWPVAPGAVAALPGWRAGDAVLTAADLEAARLGLEAAGVEVVLEWSEAWIAAAGLDERAAGAPRWLVGFGVARVRSGQGRVLVGLVDAVWSAAPLDREALVALVARDVLGALLVQPARAGVVVVAAVPVVGFAALWALAPLAFAVGRRVGGGGAEGG